MKISVKIKNKVLQGINTIYEKSKKCKLEESFFNSVDTELQLIAEYLKINKSQAFLYSVVFSKNYKGTTVDFTNLIKYFKCSPVQLLYMSKDFDFLTEKGYFKIESSRYRSALKRSNYQYYINETIPEALLNSKPLPVLNNNKFDDIYKLLNYIYDIGKKKENNEINLFLLRHKILKVINNNLEHPLIKWLDSQPLKIYDKFIVLYLIWKKLNGNENVYLSKTFEVIYDDPLERIKEIQKIIGKNHELIKLKLIKIEGEDYMDYAKVELSDNAIKIIKKHNIELYTPKIEKEYIIKPRKIPEKQLFYNQNEKEHIEMLNNILENKNMSKIKRRLKSKNLPTGITVLFFGAPGTGKTETVYQSAKKTGREIMQVDISNTKSMWFGQSEKKMKEIFTEYKELLKESKKIPVLLFNEADAIISKRQNNSIGNTVQTENTIQNIILQELETFEGIFIATTNLPENFDSAFERRFLFKIEFKKPDNDTKLKIWKSKLKGLTKEEYDLLNTKFDLTGGQIDNIVRKINMYEVLNGRLPSLTKITEFCETEKLSNKDTAQIGFK
ncbi:MAG: AAA family ATPase [Bacteroidales bacterium]|nr:AAA family ATPase [Bacteroidales bacterium]